MDIRNLHDVPAFTTKDGSEIRELLAYRNSLIKLQSLAAARVAPGLTTTLHYHVKSEEIYYITSGRGRVRVGHEYREVQPGDAVAIPPGALHQITGLGSEDLTFLCCCTPPYEHEDTVLMEETKLAR
ncbi:MAG: cupin domain-containing protein [Pirellulales bacterium]|nr:cupin domain-containing protein [Pirellulales bacterium]